MSRDTLILIAFCVFALLLGMRMKQRFSDWKARKNNVKVNKNQRPKMASAEEPEFVRQRRLRRERRVRVFTIAQLVVLLGLMIYMIPALTRDLMAPGHVDATNIILRCLIFLFSIYIFILGYAKAFRRNHRDDSEN